MKFYFVAVVRKRLKFATFTNALLTVFVFWFLPLLLH